MLKKFFVVLSIALAAILVLCWIYLPAFSRYHELKREKEQLSKRIQEIDSQIKTLADEKYLLQNDLTYLEKVIREELGFVKPGEIIYEMVTKKDPQSVLVETSSLAGEMMPSKTGMSGDTSLSAVSAKPTTSSLSVPSAKKPSSKTGSTKLSSVKKAAPKKRSS